MLFHSTYGYSGWGGTRLKLGASNSIWVSHVDAGIQVLRPFSAAFLVGSWIRKGWSTWNPTCTHRGQGLRPNLKCYNQVPQVLLNVQKVFFLFVECWQELILIGTKVKAQKAVNSILDLEPHTSWQPGGKTLSPEALKEGEQQGNGYLRAPGTPAVGPSDHLPPSCYHKGNSSEMQFEPSPQTLVPQSDPAPNIPGAQCSGSIS